MTTNNGHALAYCSVDEIKVSERKHPFIEASFDSLMMAYPEVDQEFLNKTIFIKDIYTVTLSTNNYI